MHDLYIYNSTAIHKNECHNYSLYLVPSGQHGKIFYQTQITSNMDMKLPTSELLKVQWQDTDRLVAARSRESVKDAIASAQGSQPTNSENKKVATRLERPRGSSYESVGIGNKCLGHRKSMDPHPGTCLRLYVLRNARNWQRGERIQ